MTMPSSPARPLRWGILGTGGMARTIAQAIAEVDDAELVAVGSRDVARAAAFATEQAIPHGFGSYAALASCDDVDIVYVATPPSAHLDDVLLCLDAGRHVLCEKPFALDHAQARQMVDRARSKGLFLMEALWTRFLPGLRTAKARIDEGAIGAPRMMIAGGAFQPVRNPNYYLHDAQLGGGVMRDAGIYLLHLAHMFLGPPTAVVAAGHHVDGVDSQAAVILRFADGALASLFVSMEARKAPFLEILGDAGSLTLEPPVFNPAAILLRPTDRAIETIDCPADGSAYRHEIIAMCDAIRSGQREAPLLGLDESLAVMKTLDRVMAAL